MYWFEPNSCGRFGGGEKVVVQSGSSSSKLGGGGRGLSGGGGEGGSPGPGGCWAAGVVVRKVRRRWGVGTHGAVGIRI